MGWGRAEGVGVCVGITPGLAMSVGCIVGAGDFGGSVESREQDTDAAMRNKAARRGTLKGRSLPNQRPVFMATLVARLISLSASFLAMARRLSYSFFPLTNASSTLAT